MFNPVHVEEIPLLLVDDEGACTLIDSVPDGVIFVPL